LQIIRLHRIAQRDQLLNRLADLQHHAKWLDTLYRLPTCCIF
jgi:hypothetical protein